MGLYFLHPRCSYRISPRTSYQPPSHHFSIPYLLTFVSSSVSQRFTLFFFWFVHPLIINLPLSCNRHLIPLIVFPDLKQKRAMPCLSEVTQHDCVNVSASNPPRLRGLGALHQFTSFHCFSVWKPERRRSFRIFTPVTGRLRSANKNSLVLRK